MRKHLTQYGFRQPHRRLPGCHRCRPGRHLSLEGCGWNLALLRSAAARRRTRAWHQQATGSTDTARCRRTTAGTGCRGRARPAAANAQVTEQVRQDVAAAKIEKCKKAEDIYAQSVQARRMYKVDAQGNKTFLTESELDEARVNAKIQRDNACN